MNAKPSEFDSRRLFALEDEIRSGANWLIYLSCFTLVSAVWLGPFLFFQGCLYLILAFIVRARQSLAAALLLLVAAIGTIVVALSAGDVLGEASALGRPLGLIVAAVTALNAYKFQRLLREPASKG